MEILKDATVQRIYELTERLVNQYMTLILFIRL